MSSKHAWTQELILLTLRTNDQTTALLGSLVDSLNDINQFLFILQNPIELVIVSGPEIAHHVFVAVEEKEGHWVLTLVSSLLLIETCFEGGGGSYV